MPVDVKITQANGKTEIVHLPVNVWQRDAKWTFKYPSTSVIKTVVIDPENELPDIDLDNNIWKGK